MKVRDIMTQNVFHVGAAQSLNDAAQLMWEHNCGSAPVVNEDNHVIAMITDRDIAMAAYLEGKCLADIAIATVQSDQLVCCKQDDDIAEVEYLMQTHQLHRIPVIDEQSKPVGIVSLNDIATSCQAGSRGVKPKDVSDTLAAICGSMQAKGITTESAAA